MSKLRAPDPTLDSLEGAEPLLLDHATDLPVAHRPGRGEDPACGLPIGEYDAMWIIADFARWLAVPCRACFPRAPEPGHSWSRYVLGTAADVAPYQHQSPYLSWQVTS